MHMRAALSFEECMSNIRELSQPPSRQLPDVSRALVCHFKNKYLLALKLLYISSLRFECYPYFLPGSPHVIRIERRQALIPYQYYHMMLHLLSQGGRDLRLRHAGGQQRREVTAPSFALGVSHVILIELRQPLIYVKPRPHTSGYSGYASVRNNTP